MKNKPISYYANRWEKFYNNKEIYGLPIIERYDEELGEYLDQADADFLIKFVMRGMEMPLLDSSLDRLVAGTICDFLWVYKDRSFDLINVLEQSQYYPKVVKMIWQFDDFNDEIQEYLNKYEANRGTKPI